MLQTKIIGIDNGIGDAFYADIVYPDGMVCKVIIYGENMQGASRLIRLFAEIENFNIVNMY